MPRRRPDVDAVVQSRWDILSTFSDGVEVSAAGRRWRAIVADQRDIEALRTARDAIVAKFGGIEPGLHRITVNALAPGLVTPH